MSESVRADGAPVTSAACTELAAETYWKSENELQILLNALLPGVSEDSIPKTPQATAPERLEISYRRDATEKKSDERMMMEAPVYMMPYDLICVIVSQLEDHKSVKACALVSSIFREPTQRILLRTVSVGAKKSPYCHVQDILQESPHLAAYIRRLNFFLPRYAVPSEMDSFLSSLFNKMTNITSLLVSGTADNSCQEVVNAVINTIRQPQLSELCLYSRTIADRLAERNKLELQVHKLRVDANTMFVAMDQTLQDLYVDCQGEFVHTIL